MQQQMLLANNNKPTLQVTANNQQLELTIKNNMYQGDALNV